MTETTNAHGFDQLVAAARDSISEPGLQGICVVTWNDDGKMEMMAHVLGSEQEHAAKTLCFLHAINLLIREEAVDLIAAKLGIEMDGENGYEVEQ